MLIDSLLIVLLILIYIGVHIALTLVAMGAFFAWGGVRRNAPTLLAVGVMSLAIGTIFLAVNYSSARAAMDNAYLLNIFLGLWCVLTGATSLFGSLVGFGVPWWIALPLIVVGIGGEFYAYKRTADSITISTARPLPAGATGYGGELLIICAAAILAVTVALALIRGRWRSLAQVER